MNKTEQRAYDYLLRRYPPEEITYRVRHTPSFFTRDGAAWEPKLARRKVLTMTAAQQRRLRKHPRVSLVVFDGPAQDEPDILSLDNLGPYTLTLADTRNDALKLEDDDLAQLNRLARQLRLDRSAVLRLALDALETKVPLMTSRKAT